MLTVGAKVNVMGILGAVVLIGIVIFGFKLLGWI